MLCIYYEIPNMVEPSGIYCIEDPGEFRSQSVEVRLAVSGGQPLFTLGLPMFSLSLQYFLSLLWGPSNNIDFFYLCQKCYLKYTNIIFKIFHVCFKLE